MPKHVVGAAAFPGNVVNTEEISFGMKHRRTTGRYKSGRSQDATQARSERERTEAEGVGEHGDDNGSASNRRNRPRPARSQGSFQFAQTRCDGHQERAGHERQTEEPEGSDSVVAV
jgi:hypothetical protein